MHNNEKGIALIYVTLFLLVLGILFFALGIDIGWMAYVKSQGQTTVDAAALSGAAAIPSANSSNDQTKVNELAMAFNGQNTVMNVNAAIDGTHIQLCGDNPENPTCPFDAAKAAGVRVIKTYNTPLFFTRFLNGADSTNISVSATAWLGGAYQGCKPTEELPCIPVALNSCKVPRNLDGSLNCGGTILMNPETGDNAHWTPFSGTGTNDVIGYIKDESSIPEIMAGKPINLIGTGVATIAYQELKKLYEGKSVVLPVVACEGEMANDVVVGFATMDITTICDGNDKDAPCKQGEKLILGALNCSNAISDSPGGGEFFGTYASRPVLVK